MSAREDLLPTILAVAGIRGVGAPTLRAGEHIGGRLQLAPLCADQAGSRQTQPWQAQTRQTGES